jgi:hypothetical protein
MWPHADPIAVRLTFACCYVGSYKRREQLSRHLDLEAVVGQVRYPKMSYSCVVQISGIVLRLEITDCEDAKDRAGPKIRGTVEY